MTQAPAPPRPGATPRSEADRAERQAREAAALRDNLHRRKAQQRSRAPEPGAAAQQTPHTGQQPPD